MTSAPRTWSVSLPCPRCGSKTVIGFNYVNEEGEMMHTRYVCTFWRSGPPGLHKESPTRPCEWMGWHIPAWETLGGDF